MTSTEALAREVMDRLDLLAGVSESPECLTRRYLTREHAAANEQVGAWMDEAGMSVRVDEAGNVVGRYEGVGSGAPALMVGSHLDTIISAGRYDGMLGVVLPISCIRALHSEGRRFPFAIEVIGFGDEEGVRFQSTYLGSRAVAGTFDVGLLERRDGDDISLAQALLAFGLDPATIGRAARDPTDVLAYLEIHIEQGPVLERLDCPVGVVTAIAGATRLEIAVCGEAGHAGTVPMRQRRDALAAAAEMVLGVEAICGEGRDTVGTVGRIVVSPGSVNVIPGAVHFSVDLRAPCDRQRHETLGRARDAMTSIAERRGVEIEVLETHASDSVTCADDLTRGLASAAEARGYGAPRLASGAGHDAAAMSRLTDVGMLFVRCKGGVSHHPAESVSADDVAVAAAVLVGFLQDFESTGGIDVGS